MQATLRLLSAAEFRRRRELFRLAPYVVAGAVLVFGFFAGLRISPMSGAATALLQTGYFTSLGITIHATFAWGRRCGFAVYAPGTGFSLENLLRNGLMSVVMFLAVVMATAPFLAFAAAVARRNS